MEGFVKGDVVILSFPYSDLSNIKKRPAIVIATTKGHNIILSQITIVQRNNEDLIHLTKKDFTKGNLNKDSFINVSQILTTKESRISYKVGKLGNPKIKEVEQKLCEIFTR